MGHESSHPAQQKPSRNETARDLPELPSIQAFSDLPEPLTPKTPKTPKTPLSNRVLSPGGSSHSLRSSRVLTPKTMSSIDLLSEQSSSNLMSKSSIPRTYSMSTGKIKRRRRSSLLNVYNGITGKFISSRICKIAARFWRKEIDDLTVPEQLEIGCSIFFGMMSAGPDTKNIMQRNFKQNKNIECTSLKYLDMMGWLIRHLTTDKIDLYSLLTKLGVLHMTMGIHIKHYAPMLRSMHETFAYYFQERYSIEVKYAIDEIFSLAAQLMTGQELKCSHHLNDIAHQFQANNVPFLKSLDHCLRSKIGKDYLYRYLSQTWCDEMVIFLQALFRFRVLMTDKERFFVAREINKISIDPHATFCLNLSYETRKNTMDRMSAMEAKFAAKESLQDITADFYAEVEREVYKLIMDNHWIKFVGGIKELQSKSFYLE